MSDSYVVPVSAGLAVGVVFVLGFSFFAQNSPLAITSRVPVVTIPKGASSDEPVTFYPEEITVMIGYNNTVRWINRDDVAHLIKADNKNDLAFWNATASQSKFISPYSQYEFTFEKPGEFDYHGEPWMRGRVVVVPHIPLG